MKVQSKVIDDPLGTIKIYGIRDEVDMPIEDFAGQALAAEGILALNQDVYVYDCDPASNKVMLQLVLSLQHTPSFLVIHHGNLITDSGIYCRSQEAQKSFYDEEKYFRS